MDIPEPAIRPIEILGFSGEYRFLSNFHPVAINYGGHIYGSTESAYQAAKCKNPEEAKTFVGISPGVAKRKGRAIELREDWNAIKDSVMMELTLLKYQNKELAEQLLQTGNAYIEETNVWHDMYWGVDAKTGKGKNKLGIILMTVRGILGGHGITEKTLDSITK